MFSVKPLLISAALGCAALMAPIAAQAGVVIKSSGPSASKYPVGMKLSDSGRITLQTGDSVTILANGGTRVISGAGTHRVAERGKSNRTAIAALTRRRAAGQVRTGATRGDPPPASLTSPNLWWVDVSKSGTMCVADMSAVQMWRPGRDQASTYVIASAESAEHVHVTFLEDEMVTAWDSKRLPLAEGSTYSITGPSGGAPATIKFTQMDAVPEDLDDLTVALLGKGCTTQVDLLATTLM